MPFLIAIFLFAGFVKGVISLGLPTIAMGLLGLTMAPADAAALLLVPSLVTNVWQLLAGPAFGPLVRRLWSMMAGVVVGTLAGSRMISGGAEHAATAGLGLALVAYAGFGLLRPALRVPARWEAWLSPLVGLVTGLVTGATGVFVLPAVPYLGALALERDALVQALGLSFTVSTLALAAGLGVHGAIAGGMAWISVLVVAPALIGMAAGGWVRARVRPDIFRRCFFLGLIALGLELSWRGLSSIV